MNLHKYLYMKYIFHLISETPMYIFICDVKLSVFQKPYKFANFPPLLRIFTQNRTALDFFIRIGFNLRNLKENPITKGSVYRFAKINRNFPPHGRPLSRRYLEFLNAPFSCIFFRFESDRNPFITG